jgi:hypothetical protein
VSRHDWGSFALGFLFRCGALFFLTEGWVRERWPWLALGGVCVGLGLYNKIDFVVFPFGAAIGLLAAAPGVVRAAVGRRWRHTAAAAAGFVVAVSPLLLAASDAGTVTLKAFHTADINPVTVDEKLATLRTTLDGSRFEALMRAGGKARYIADLDPAAGPFVVVLGVCLLALAVRLARARERDAAWRTDLFLAVTTVGIVVGLLIVPRTERIHHALNLYPFPQLVVATVAAGLWRRDAGFGLPAGSRRGLAIALVAISVLGSVFVHWQTWKTLHRSGGKGLWSDVRMRHTAELETEKPLPTAVALDWGFAWGLRYEHPDLPLLDLPAEMRAHGNVAWSFEGDASDDYLLYPDRYATFPHGARFLAAARRLPPALVSVRDHFDGQGDLAFRSVRIRHPHRVKIGRGIAIELR